MEFVINNKETSNYMIDRGDLFTSELHEFLLALVRNGNDLYSLVALNDQCNYYSEKTSNKSLDVIREIINELMISDGLIRHPFKKINTKLVIDYK